MELNKIYNMDCLEFLEKCDKMIDVVMTSPPYGTERKHSGDKERAMKNHERRYDVYQEFETEEDYISFTIELFKKLDGAVKENGCVLYNLSYSSENTHMMWHVISDIMRNTNWIVADDIIWKKKSALPNNVSKNKLTRIVEHVFVFCRKDEFKTFNCNKQVKSYSKTGQAYYENVFNFVEAKNNDGTCKLNKATYSSELCEKILGIYAKQRDVVYDPFMGTGTTAVACQNLSMNYLGTELSKEQCDFAEDRLAKNGLKVG